MEAGVHCIIWQIRLRQTHLLQNIHFFLDQRPAWIGKYARLHVSWRPGTNPRGVQTSYTPQVIISRSFSNQVVNVHVVGLSDTMHSVLCLNENLRRGKKSIQIFMKATRKVPSQNDTKSSQTFHWQAFRRKKNECKRTVLSTLCWACVRGGDKCHVLPPDSRKARQRSPGQPSAGSDPCWLPWLTARPRSCQSRIGTSGTAAAVRLTESTRQSGCSWRSVEETNATVNLPEMTDLFYILPPGGGAAIEMAFSRGGGFAVKWMHVTVTRLLQLIRSHCAASGWWGGKGCWPQTKERPRWYLSSH